MKPDQLKAIGAAMAATGAVALYHVEGMTPEARKNRFDLSGLYTIPVEQAEIAGLFQISRWTPWRSAALTAPRGTCGDCPAPHGKVVTKPFYVFAAQGVIDRNAEWSIPLKRAGPGSLPTPAWSSRRQWSSDRSIMVNTGKALAYVPICAADMHGSGRSPIVPGRQQNNLPADTCR